MKRKIIAYKNYFGKFIENLSEKERIKVQRALALFNPTW
jgi:hypothetical protein